MFACDGKETVHKHTPYPIQSCQIGKLWFCLQENAQKQINNIYEYNIFSHGLMTITFNESPSLHYTGSYY